METKKPIVMLLSKVGRGKTTFYNKLCNQQQRAHFGGESCTRDLFLKCTSYGQGFYLMDTPGFGCDEDIIIHLSALFVAAEGPLNAILILTKFDRSCVMKEEINQALSMLSPCRDIIIIIVTFWDDAEKESIEDQDKFKKNIEEQVIQPLKLKSFICTSQNTPGDLICQQLDQQILQNVKQSVQLTPQEFSFQFSKLSSFSIQDEMETHKLKQAFKNKCDGALKFIEQQKDNTEEMAELMHELILAVKEEAYASVIEFTKQNRKKFDKLVEKFGICEYTYLAYTKLTAVIMGFLEDVIQKALEKMQTYEYHVYNFIRKCPHCGLVWLKVLGCENETYCGKKPEKDDENLTPQPKKYKIEYRNSIWQVINQSNSKSNKIIKGQQNNQITHSLGCGKLIDWKNCPLLSNDQIKELKNTGYLDLLKMVQNKDSKDLENEQKFWDQFNRLRDENRRNLIKQILDCGKDDQEDYLKKVSVLNQESSSSKFQDFKSQNQNTISKTSIRDDIKLEKKKKKCTCSNQSCSIS